eukprot:COSAG01_NODE_62219_length_285_cov_2.215054_1_plen_71_part_01
MSRHLTILASCLHACPLGLIGPPRSSLAPQPRKKGLSVGANYQHLPTSYPPPAGTLRGVGAASQRACAFSA